MTIEEIFLYLAALTENVMGTIIFFVFSLFGYFMHRNAIHSDNLLTPFMVPFTSFVSTILWACTLIIFSVYLARRIYPIISHND